MRRWIIRSWGALVLVLTSGASCAAFNDPAIALVRVKAEKDLKCKPDFIEIESGWGGRYRAEGCGRTAEYDSVCDGIQCEVTSAGDEAPGWRDRPTPGSVEDRMQ